MLEFDTNMRLRLIDTTCKLKKLFPYKDKQPHLQQFDVIYQLKCDRGALYTGQAGRNLITTTLFRHSNKKAMKQKTKLTIQHIKSTSIIVQFYLFEIIGENI